MFTKRELKQIKKELANEKLTNKEIEEQFGQIWIDEVHEPSIEQRMGEMENYDKVTHEGHYTKKEYFEFAVEEYVQNHEDYIKMAEEINKQ